MPLIKYEDRNFKARSLELIALANDVIRTFKADDYDLTLRQLYYQLVTINAIENKQTEYDNLGRLISNARRAGLVDWNAIVDRTRELRRLAHWDGASDGIAAIAQQFRLDLWSTQESYVEVWFEKDALLGVFERAADRVDVPYFSCRGYPSDSEVWSAARRLSRQANAGNEIVVLHFGDHDPSGLDMTRDIRDRIALFDGPDVDVRRLALNMDQVEEMNLPPNPAKESDGRFSAYVDRYNTTSSWELDALKPTVLARIVADAVEGIVDRDAWNDRLEEQAAERGMLAVASKQWDDVDAFLRKGYRKDVKAAIARGNAGLYDLDDEEDAEEE